MIWADYMENSAAVRGTFGADIPPLEDMELSEIYLRMPELYLVFTKYELPPSAPRKWRDRGYDAYQVKFSFFASIDDLHIQGVLRRIGTFNNFKSEPPVAADRVAMLIDGKKILIERPQCGFSLRFSYQHAMVSFSPFCMAHYEFLPPHVHRQH